SRPPPIIRTPRESLDRAISIETAARWNPTALNQVRDQQRNAIAIRMQQFQLPHVATSRNVAPPSPARTSLRAVGSIFVSAASIFAGPALFGAVQGMRGAPDSVGVVRTSYVVWMIAALLGVGLGIAALLSIRRSANRLRGFRRAWAGTGLGLLMAMLALLA